MVGLIKLRVSLTDAVKRGRQSTGADYIGMAELIGLYQFSTVEIAIDNLWG